MLLSSEGSVLKGVLIFIEATLPFEISCVMKSLIRFSLLSLTLLVAANIEVVYSQGVSSSGTDFWLAFMPNGIPSLGGFDRIELFIASGTSNKVQVTLAGTTKSITLQPNSISDMLLDDVATTRIAETPTNNAVHITSANPITVYGYSVWSFAGGLGGSPDGFLALPITSYGKKYYTVNFPDSKFGTADAPGEFLIVAPYAQTDVTITPTSDTKANGAVSHKAGVPWTVTLSKGQSYLVQSPGDHPGEDDLTGSLVTSTQPIAVLTGHEISSVPIGQNSADHMLEMLPPVDRWGTQYFDMPMAGRVLCGDYIRILSAEDGNQITYNGRGPFYLNAGEYADRDLVTDPEVYTSTVNKKFIVAEYSYSQGFNGDPATADPFMVLFTPQEQFEKEMILRTPTPAQSGTFNNYITFIALYDSIKKITVNGRGIATYPFVGLQPFPNTNPQMAGYRVKLSDGANNYVAQGPTPFGAYQYGFATYEGYGWPTGMAQRIVSLDTLPPLVSVLDSECGTYDLRFYEPRTTSNGFSFDDSRISYLALITDPGDPRWSKPSSNYSFAPGPAFLVGDSVETATITVMDLTQDAYAAIYAVDQAGNDTVYQYYYYAPKVAMKPSPAPYSFGSVLVDADSCRMFTFSNQQAADFLAQTAVITGFAKGGTFTVTPTTLSAIPPGDSVQITVCYQPSDTGIVSLDTLTIRSQCVPYSFALNGQGITPLIYANDLDFGEVDSGLTLCKPLTIRNPGRAPLTITKQDLVNNPNFSVDPAQVFPIVIPPGGNTVVQYCFHPQSWGSFSAHVNYTDLNPAPFVHSIKDTALLTGLALPAGAQLTSYTKQVTASCTDTILFDTLYNNLAKDKLIDSVKIVGKDSKFFTIVGLQPNYPFVLVHDSLNNIPFQIQYNPLLNGFDFTSKTAILEVYSGTTIISLTITAELLVPLAQLSVPVLDLGAGYVNQSLSSTFIISNKGSAPMTVSSYDLNGADAASFTLSPAPPFTIASGGQQVVTVTATGNASRAYTAYAIITAACNVDTIAFDATFSISGDRALGTDHPKTYIGGCRSNTQNATFQNNSSKDTITITNVTIAASNGWNDISDFAFTSPFVQQIAPPNGGIVTVPILFLPTATGLRQAALVFNLQGKTATGADSIWTETVLLQGQGVAVQRTVGVGSASTPPEYHTTADGSIQIPIVADVPIDANAPDNGTSEAYGYKFDVSWKRDAFQYVDVTSPSIGIAISQMNLAYNSATGMETRSFAGTSIGSLTGQTTLATIDVKAMLDKADSSPISLTNVLWLGKDSLPLCYVSSVVESSSFILDPLCGNTTLQNFLQTGQITTTSIQEVHPNPVRGKATINYTVNSSSSITIGIYDLLGNEVRRLVDQQLQHAGVYSIVLESDGLASGSYVCRLTDGKQVSTKRFELQK